MWKEERVMNRKGCGRRRQWYVSHYQIFRRELRKKTGNLRIDGLRTEILTHDLLNTKYEC
jgi:hypothetical protein